MCSSTLVEKDTRCNFVCPSEVNPYSLSPLGLGLLRQGHSYVNWSVAFMVSSLVVRDGETKGDRTPPRSFRGRAGRQTWSLSERLSEGGGTRQDSNLRPTV